MSTTASDRPIRSQRKVFVLTLLALAICVISVANMQWFSVETVSVLGDSTTVSASGQGMSPGLTAAGMVAVAASLFLAISGRVGKYFALALISSSAVLIAVATILVLKSPSASLRPVFAEATGSDAMLEDLDVSVWPYVTLAFAIFMTITAVYAITVAKNWPDKSAKYELTELSPNAVSSAQGRPAGEVVDDERELWDSLSEGIDPTDK